MKSTAWSVIVGFGLIAAVACGDDDPDTPDTRQPADAGTSTSNGGSAAGATDGGVTYSPEFDPAGFVSEVNNPYWPLPEGARWIYEGESEGEVERIEVVVMPERVDILGISAVVVRDTVTVDGELAEDTYDWYAQDDDGNVWYLGEDSKEYEDGEVIGTEGSWKAGVDGAEAGVVMPANPEVGLAYRQEYYAGEAEDMAEIVRVGESVTVPAGSYQDVVVVREWNPLEPGVVEEKYHAPGVGVVLEKAVEGGDEQVELIEAP